MPEPDPQDAPEHDPYGALRSPSFRRYLLGNALATAGLQMQGVAALWDVYTRTGGDNLKVGLVGLLEWLPVLVLSLFAGQIADRFDRRRVIGIAMAVMSLVGIGLFVVSSRNLPLPLMYGCLVLGAVARAFQQPAKSSLVPRLIERRYFSNAVTWSSGAWQLAAASGPALGGLVIAHLGGTPAVYAINAVTAASFVVIALSLKLLPSDDADAPVAASVDEILAGLRFVLENRILLAAMSLDLFAVLLGGATALFPAFAKDILHVGASGVGAMEAAQALGALTMSMIVAHRPPFARAGRALFMAVAGFGIATIVFGFSRWFPLSLLMLFSLGLLDSVSVVVRQTLVQVLTPDRLRGRVSAVNGIFIGSSNELGAFESGTVARLTSPTISVVLGGVGTLLVLSAVGILAPQLRRFGRLDVAAPAVVPEEAQAPERFVP